MAVQTLTDKRFRRAHVRPSRRRRAAVARRRLALGVVSLAVVLLAAFLLPSLLRTAAFLQVETITLQGNEHVSHGEVLALIGQLRGQNILVVDLEAEREHLMTLGWIKTATLRRVLPATVEVSIEEREPVGLARFGGRLYLIDRSGMVIDEHGPRFADRVLPIIDGLSAGQGAATVDPNRAQLASSLMTALESDPELAARVSQIDVEDPYDAVVLLSDGPTLIHLGNQLFVERLREYLELAPALRGYVADIDYVDLRFERRIFIRPREPATGSGPRVAASRANAASLQR